MSNLINGWDMNKSYEESMAIAVARSKNPEFVRQDFEEYVNRIFLLESINKV